MDKGMNFGEAINSFGGKNLFIFSGRSRRREFWYSVAFYYIGVLILVQYMAPQISLEAGSFAILLKAIGLCLVGAVMNSAVTIRRLHDTGRSGWHTLWALLPVVGPFILLFFLVQNSQKEQNKWGDYPK